MVERQQAHFEIFALGCSGDNNLMAVPKRIHNNTMVNRESIRHDSLDSIVLHFKRLLSKDSCSVVISLSFLLWNKDNGNNVHFQ